MDRWYKNLPAKNRLFMGIGIMAYAVGGMWLSDRAEEKLGLVPNEQDKEDLQKMMPKIRTVERKSE